MEPKMNELLLCSMNNKIFSQLSFFNNHMTKYIKKTAGLFVLFISLFASLGVAYGADNLQDYFNSVSVKVKATADPVQKREILDKGFQTVTNALTVVENLPVTTQSDRAGIERYKAVVQDKQDELNGKNGYARVSDGQLNAFSNYVVQNMEQADVVITISLVTLLLIIIIILLIV